MDPLKKPFHHHFGPLHVRAYVNTFQVHVDPGGAPRVFALDDRRAVDDFHFRNVGERDAGTVRGDDRQEFQLFDRIAHALRITQVHGITFQAFHR